MKKFVSVTYRPSPEVFRKVKLLLAEQDGSWQELIDRLIVAYLDDPDSPTETPEHLGKDEAELLRQLTEILRENRMPQMMGTLRELIAAMHDGGPAATPRSKELPDGSKVPS